MDKKTITPLIISILLIIFLLLPYKKNVIEKLYDPNTNYRAFKKINRVDSLYKDLLIIYNEENSKMDFYYNQGYSNNPLIRNIKEIIYLEVYNPPYSQEDSVPDEWYEGIILISEYGSDDIKYFYGYLIAEISKETYLENKDIVKDFLLEKNKELIEPFIPKLHTPKEFYETYKEYFVPYYLADYEVKK